MTIAFQAALGFLATATGDDAKAGETLELRFTPPPKVPLGPALPFIESELGTDVLGRFCCAMGVNRSVGFADLGFHKYRPRFAGSTMLDSAGEEGGRHGFLYTRRGGLIDLGHVRDNIDYVRFFAARYYNAPASGQTGALSFVFKEGADIHLEIAARTGRPSPELSAAMAAKQK